MFKILLSKINLNKQIYWNSLVCRKMKELSIPRFKSQNPSLLGKNKKQNEMTFFFFLSFNLGHWETVQSYKLYKEHSYVKLRRYKNWKVKNLFQPRCLTIYSREYHSNFKDVYIQNNNTTCHSSLSGKTRECSRVNFIDKPRPCLSYHLFLRFI